MGARLDAALGYAALGRSVIPIAPGGKVPAIEWRRYQTERATEDRIRHWWTRDDWNIGVVCGAISSVVVLDVDGHHDGYHTLAQLVATHGLPLTSEASTPSGGSHLWFTHPGRPVGNSAGKLGAGLDFRGDGGFVVVPPSARPEGTYRWCEWLVEPQPLPDWLLQLAERDLAPAKEITPWRARIQAAARPPGRGYVKRAVEDELDQLEREGGHGALTRSAFRLGQLAHLGVAEDETVEALADAALVKANPPRDRAAALRTAKECFDAGKAEPRTPQ